MPLTEADEIISGDPDLWRNTRNLIILVMSQFEEALFLEIFEDI